MCTAISMYNNYHYFGRTLDIEYSIEQNIVITPRNFPFHFRNEKTIEHHFAIIGTAMACEGYPLYYEATNEAGLSIAGLNFAQSAFFHPFNKDMYNIETFELIPWILSTCTDTESARRLIERTNIMGSGFNAQYGAATLHWIIADKKSAIVLESTQDGIKTYDNPVGVLTNEPQFPYHLTNLNNYINLSTDSPKNRFCETIDISPYSNGMGAIGLPGDVSSASRFVRAAFTKLNSVNELTENQNVSQFFHILGTVEQVRGCVRLTNGKHEITAYTSCCNTDKCIYYYTTYENRQITAVDMYSEKLDTSDLKVYPMRLQQNIFYENKVSCHLEQARA